MAPYFAVSTFADGELKTAEQLQHAADNGGDDLEATTYTYTYAAKAGGSGGGGGGTRLWQRVTAMLRGIVGVLITLVLLRIGASLCGYDVSISISRAGEWGDSDDWTTTAGSGRQRVSPSSSKAVTTKAPKPNVWAPISEEDNRAVWEWLHDPAQGLNLTQQEEAGINDNQVYWIDTVHMNKSDVLAFVDGNGTQPAQYARVILYEGGRTEPVAQEYMVGPLPVGPETTMAKLDYIYNGGMGGAVPYDARGMDGARRRALDLVLGPAMGGIADITRSLFSGAAYFGQHDKRTTVRISSGTPLSLDGTQAHIHVVFHFPGPAMYLLPLDFYALIEWSGTDARLWRVRGFVTKGRLFADEAELRAAFEAGELEPEFRQRRDYDWALVKYQPALGGPRPLEERAAPQSREVGGKRYRVDSDARYVEYMGWSFYVSHTRSLGVMFFDVRFRGERILYELSMQEAASQYGGHQPKAASTVYHDTTYSLGADVFSLVEGFDCPRGSTFWDVSFHEGNRTVRHGDAICLFEQDPGHPLSRHRAADGDETGAQGLGSVGVVRDAQLVVRFVATVGNYDYLFSYAFGLDGSLDVSVRASGYLMSSPLYATGTNGTGGRLFGPRIQEATQGSIHDHVLTFKADFDLLGTANSLEATTLRAVPQAQPWFADLGEFEQLQLDVETVATERQLSWAPNQATMYSVVASDEQRNAWGERRGYRVLPGRSNVHLTTLKSPWSRDNMAFAKADLAVSRQHDTEPYASSVHNANLPWRPQQDFARLLDGETVDGADLVLWFNLGMHHFTRAEDVPVTLFSQAVSSISFAPQNFFDRAQDGDLTNRRWVERDPVEGPRG